MKKRIEDLPAEKPAERKQSEFLAPNSLFYLCLAFLKCGPHLRFVFSCAGKYNSKRARIALLLACILFFAGVIVVPVLVTQLLQKHTIIDSTVPTPTPTSTVAAVAAPLTYPGMVLFYTPATIPPPPLIIQMEVMLLNNDTGVDSVPLDSLSYRFYYAVSLTPAESIVCITYYAGVVPLTQVLYDDLIITDLVGVTRAVQVRFNSTDVFLGPGDSLDRVVTQCHISPTYRAFDYTRMYSYRDNVNFTAWDQMPIFNGAELLEGVLPASQ